MPKAKTTIEIPMDLARLLTSEPDDFKEPQKYDDVQKLGKALLKVLMEAQK